MTHFFKYEHLTWPDVASLPRNLPLILPLGTGYSLDSLANVLGNPERAGILPALPFGWQGSGLPVSPPRLAAILDNLTGGLYQDGFARVYVLTPSDLALPLQGESLSLPVEPQYAGHLPADEERDKVVLIPIGHTEQHGYHLPLNTDTVIIDAISQGTVRQAPDAAVSLPVTPYGVSMHRASFAGTLSAGGRAFEDFWLEVVDVLAGRGFNRFYFLNGHGGNGSFLINVVKYAGERWPRVFCATAFLYLSGPEGIAALENHRRSPTGGMGHACELETSLMLHLSSELVHMERVVDETDFISTPSYYMDWIEGGALVANPPWDDDTHTGAYGAGSLAAVENGAIWLQAAIAEKAVHVQEIHEQYRRRAQRNAAKRHLSPPSL